SIEYSRNDVAGIPSHALIELHYTDDDHRCGQTWWRQPGPVLPAGAAMSYRTGSREITGIWRLYAITSSVRDTPGSEWRQVRSWTFDYDATTEGCDGAVSPRRHLLSISELGSTIDGKGGIVVTQGPSVQFSYGPYRDFTDPDQ